MILTYARLSAEEIEEKTGVPATEAIARLTELLRNRGWMSIKQREMLLLSEIDEVITDAKTRLSNASDRDYAAIANVILKGVESALKRIDAARRNTEIDVYEITAGNARTYGNSFDAAIDAIFKELRYDHPEEYSDKRLNDLKMIGMNAAADYMADHIAEEE
jgi:hypothetical protein